MKALFAATAVLCPLFATAALAQAPTQAPATGSKMSTSSHMTSSAGHTKETKTDMMMVKNCLAMPKAKMAADAECQDYMKNHPDWMKAKK